MDGFDGVFLGKDRARDKEPGCDVRVSDSPGPECAGVRGGCLASSDELGGCSTLVIAATFATDTGNVLCMLISGGSEDGGSETVLGFNGVRKGDLNGLWRVFAASFSRRRLACGVDIFVGTLIVGIFKVQMRSDIR